MLQKIADAARTYDRPATEALVAQAIDAARRGKVFEERLLRNALTALRDNRWFDLLRDAGDALILTGEMRPSIHKLYAQALIDTGVISAAVPFLERLAVNSKGFEHDEARALLGRAWKQAYVSRDALTQSLAKKVMERALEQYYAPYAEDHDNLYQGINTVAMLCRAERDGLAVSGAYPDPRALAKEILDRVLELDDNQRAQPWDYATAAEASVALGEWARALEWMNRYLPDASAFAAAGTLRQLVEVWQICATDDDGGGPLVNLLEAEKLSKKGGESIDVAGAHASLQSIDRQRQFLQAVLGEERYKTIDWLRTGFARAKNVARVGSIFRTFGTGFLVDIDGQQLLLTNHHVSPEAIACERALVTFDAREGDKRRYRIAEQLWTSPVGELDATIVRLDAHVEDVEPYPLCADVPPLDPPSRVYVIGHPHGGTMSFSIADNLLIADVDPRLQYRAPTDPGSSGSPVFDEDWSLLALHHAGARDMPKLDGDGVWPANEGIDINEVFERFRARA
ncbi:MAG TPA: serine protease [Thermoanaerobaculia bacterium]|nr:serine protease [Thermoanaerobaculia bacterium]